MQSEVTMVAEVPGPTARLVFRWWRADDLGLASALWGDPRVTASIGGPFDPPRIERMLEEQRGWARTRGVQYWPIFDRDHGGHAGCCGLRPRDDGEPMELGFHLRPAFWGRGLAHEAALATIEHAFESLGLPALFAGHHPDNTPSRRLLLRLGFRHTHDEHYPPTGRMHPSYLLEAPSPAR